MEIKNREAIVEELTEMLIQFDKDCNEYQTDVYAYYDEETQTVTLDTFVNVGGNSWLDDDHMTIHSDKEHYDKPIMFFQTIEELAYALEITESDLKKEAAIFCEIDEEDVEWNECYDLIKRNDEYMDKIECAYADYVEEHHPDYAENAEEIIRQYENRYDERV